MNKGNSITAMLVVWLCLVALVGNCFSAPQNDEPDKVVRVFVLAGQSNMQTAGRYNSAALEIMQENEIPINDLFAFCQSRDDLQRPKDVHFNPAGSKALGVVVAAEIQKLLTKKETEK